MAKITIDGVDYDTDGLTEEAKAQLASLQFCDVELKRLQAETASIQTALIAYAGALRAELYRITAAATVDKTSDPAGEGAAEPDSKPEKKGLFGGLFGKK